MMTAKRKSLLAKYHEILQEKLEGRRGEFLYRGQENIDWPLRSGAVRRLFSNTGKPNLQEFLEKGKRRSNFHEKNIRYHEKGLLEKARLRGWHREADGRELKNLELLAKLQHYGAATCLLDFTARFDIALWFACKKVGGQKDGVVFIVDRYSVPRLDLQEIVPDDLKYGISEILRFETRETEGVGQPSQKLKFWYWYPETMIGRMLSQESRFLFGPEDIPEGDYLFSIRIEDKDKEQLLVEMKRHYGLSPESVFSDIRGFATANTYRASFQEEGRREDRTSAHRRDIEDYRQEGIRKIQTGDYSAAIKILDKVLKLNENDAEALLYRGIAQFGLGME